MKKLALILFVAVQAITASAQQTINFKIAFKPNTIYKQSSEQYSKNSISYGEDTEPMEQETHMKTVAVTTTGKLTDGTMPLTIKLEPEAGSDLAAVMPNGATVHGVVKKDGMPQLDSINAPGTQEQIKNIFMTMANAMASQNLISERKVKVGESFTIEKPAEMPMGPITMVMNTKTTYRLNKVEGKKAYFDINLTVDITSKDKTQNIKGSGTGSGTLVYDMDHNFFTQNNLKSSAKTELEIPGVKMSVTEETDVKANVEISQSK